jgi:putative DNA methylase
VSAARKKLIEVALPLEAINRESAREKSIRHGHPSTLHLWWSRKPLATCRAVLFASLVDDPSSRPEEFPTEEEQERERQRLFDLIEELVKWENSTNEAVLEAAREEIRRATGGNPPPVLDPFCGGGSIPLEAQRLGLEAHASDLNPVAVLITKALIEIPPKFAGRPPVNPEARGRIGGDSGWRGAQGLAEDVRHYGRWMRDEAFRRIGHLYPRAKLPDGREATVIAWLWARTVRCPNPACGAEMPLVRSFALSTKKGKEWHVEPVVDREARTVRFEVRAGLSTREGTAGRRGARCVVCETMVPQSYVRAEGMAGRIAQRLMAVVAEGERGRLYLAPEPEHERLAASVDPPVDAPDAEMATNSRHMTPVIYGMRRFSDLFTPRQLVALTTFSDLVPKARERVLANGGDGDYADAVATYMGLASGRCADFWSSLATWVSSGGFVGHTFVRQALAMTWDHAEVNPFSGSTGNWSGACEWVAGALSAVPASGQAVARQRGAGWIDPGVLVCTDPPYYDNVPYADLSDFFYVWLRRALRHVHPTLFGTLLVPKAEELVADPCRFGGSRAEARRFFEDGIAQFFGAARDAAHPDYPATLFYAFKQAESEDGATTSTGWDTMLTGLIASGFAVTGTWPMRSERTKRMREIGSNALASSIVLVCRQRTADAPLATRREFVSALRAELPRALKELQHGSIAPVDLAQAAIGPGMAVFSRYVGVVEADGSRMSVRTALALINQALDEILSAQEGDFDADTRFAVTWFEQRGTSEGPYGEADVLARAKNTSVQGMVDAGVLASLGGKVRLLARDELPEDWDPVADRRLTAWEATQHLVRRLELQGESGAADLLRRLGGHYGEQAKELAYRLYVICERKGWAQEALGYNALVVAWPEIARQVAGAPQAEAQQQLEV